LFNELRLLMAKIDHTWDQSILSYDQESQKSLLKKIFGNMKAESFTYALIGSFVVIGLFIALLFIPKRGPKPGEESKWIETLFKMFERQELHRLENETLQQFSQRIESELPKQVSTALEFIVKEYYEWKYASVEQRLPFTTLKSRLQKHVLSIHSALTNQHSKSNT
jgi:hypothetical protein